MTLLPRRAAPLAWITSIATLTVLACAGVRAPLDRPEGDAGVARASVAELVHAGLDAWLLRNDAATAERRLEEAVRRAPGDPGARMAAALLARRHLDATAEAAHLVALVDAAPDDPLVPLAARRLAELAGQSPPLARAVGQGLARTEGRARGFGAARLMTARVAAAAALGDLGAAVALRARSGAVTAWTLVGPFGGLHALELDRPFAPELGPLPAGVPAAAGLPAVPARALSTPDGQALLEGEPADGDLFYLASDVALARGGDYLLSVGGNASLRVFLDGAAVAERRAYAAFLPAGQLVPLTLSPGPHRLLVKVGRGHVQAAVNAFLLRADGAPLDGAFAAAAPGAPAAAVRPGAPPRPLDLPGTLLAGATPALGPVAARLAVARDAADSDPEAAKALLAEALLRAPGAAALRAARADLLLEDGTLADAAGRNRALVDLDAALAADPSDASARLRRAELARAQDRLDDAAALLEGLAEADAARPRALLARARLAQARGLAERAEQLAEEARRTGGDCQALELLLELALRRDALSRQDELAAAAGQCPGGLERLANHRRRRGDLAGALAAADAVVKAAPARIDARGLRAALLAARGDPRAAAEDLADLARTWPRDARIERRRAELLDEAGDAPAARAARERALLLDGSDLHLRRALAVAEGEGREPLAEWDEDGQKAIAAYQAAAPKLDTSSVTVLDFGAVEAHPGGAFTERVHTVVEARDQRAVDHVGEVAVPEGADLLLARTVKRDGRLLEPDGPLGDKRTLSLPGLEPGDFAEWIWIRSVPGRGPAVPGWTADGFFFRADTPLWRSVYVAAAPPAVGLEVDAHRMPPPAIELQGGRKVLRVVRDAVPPLFPEPSAGDDAEQVPFVQVGAGAGQQAMAASWADGLLESFRASREVRAFATRIAASVPEGGGQLPLLRAAYRAVDAEIQGPGGAIWDPASAVLSRGRGSRASLLKAVLDVLGVRTRVVLLRDFGRDPSPYRFPRPDLYARPVLRAEADGGAVWLDPSVRGAPFGALPDAALGVSGLVLPQPGEAVQEVRTPAADPAERSATRLQAVLDESGGAEVVGEQRLPGYQGALARSSLEQLDPAERRQLLEQVLARGFRGPALTDFSIQGEDDPEGPIVLHWRVRVDRWARREGDRLVIDTPVFPAQLGPQFLRRGTRETTLLVPSNERDGLALTVVPPPGCAAVPATRADVAAPYGRYVRDERREQERLVREDRIDLIRARVPPESLKGFAAFATAVDAAQQEPMVFQCRTRGGE